MKTETQKAITKYMSARKRAWAHVPRSFPRFEEGMSTSQYVHQYYALNLRGMGLAAGAHVAQHFAPLNQAPATILIGEEVTEC